MSIDLRSMAEVLLGVDVVESPALPMHPSDGENARRIVRHGMADVLGWLGEKVGPMPGEPTHALMVGRQLLCSREFAARLRAVAWDDPAAALRMVSGAA